MALIACAAVLSIGWGRLGDAAEKPSAPNIVLILADDLGRADVGFMGSKEIRTPHLDRLARGGAVLDAHYVQPVCSPTRAALMTGRYAVHTGVYTIVRPNAPWGLPLAERTLAQTLHQAGYQTAICGKWHLGEFQPAYRPTQRGFDRQYGQWFGAIDYYTHRRDGQLDWHRDDQPSQDQGYSTHLLAQEACRIIRDKKPDRPLFLYLPFNAVHGPYQVPEKYVQGLDHLSGTRRTYAGMIAAMDEAIGQVVAALEEKGLTDTLILFSSDNGGPAPGRVTSNAPLRAGKGTIYEGGIRVCAFARWPGRIPAGSVVREPIHAVDWYPTLARVAGASLDQPLPLDGADVRAVLTEGAPSPHDAILLCGNKPGQAAIRAGNWKLLVDASDADAEESAAAGKTEASKPNRPGVELYNLAVDPGETRNLAAQEPEKVQQLRARLSTWLSKAAPAGQLRNPAPAAKRAGKKRAAKAVE